MVCLYVYCCWRSSYQKERVGIQSLNGESWDPVIKRGELGSSYQTGRVGIQLSKGEGWDPVIKQGGLGSNYQKGRVGIQSSKGGGWDWFNPTTFLCLSEVRTWIPNVICCPFLCAMSRGEK